MGMNSHTETGSDNRDGLLYGRRPRQENSFIDTKTNVWYPLPLPLKFYQYGMRSLQDQFNYVTNWAKDKNVLFLDAEVKTHNSLSVYFKSDSGTDIQNFTNLIEALSGKVLFYASLFFSEDNFSECADYISKLDDEEIQTDFLRLKPFINKILRFELYFIQGGCVYAFENSVDEAHLYENIKYEMIDSVGYEQLNELSQEKALELGRIFANDVQFVSAKNRTQRVFLAKKLLPDLTEFDGNAYDKIVRISETIYEMEVKPLREQQLFEKIQALKKEGKTKVSISQLLKISKDTLNKYY
jgi:hypothetical protein